MRFDEEQIAEYVRALPQTRLAGSQNERHAADQVAEWFEKLGLKVERLEVIASRFKDLVAGPLGWIVVGLLMTAQTLLALRKGSLKTGVLLEAVALGVVVFTSLGAFPAGRRWPPRARSKVILAGRPDSSSLSTRLVFLAQLDTPAPRWPERTRELVGTLILAFVFVLGDSNTYAYLHLSRLTQLGLLAGLWLALVIRISERLDARGSVKVPDSRPALAALLELARTLPPSVYERVDVRFAAVGANSLGTAGTRALAEWARGHRENGPTLAVWIQVPESSRRLLVFGRGDGLRVALEAAKGLWIPHKVVRAGKVAPEHRGLALERAGFAVAALVGEEFAPSGKRAAVNKRTGEPAPKVPLATTVQLATEIALRWARRAADEGQGESADRSAQNPG